jgi:heat shock protein HslJ
MVPRALIAVSAVPLLLLTACGGGATPGTAGPDPTGDWTLVEGTGPEGAIPILPDSPITLTVDGTQWGGVAACNSYSGTFEVDGEEVTQVHAIAVTEMACMDDAVMASEAAYLAALPAVEELRVAEGQLVLRGPDVELVFAAVPAEPDAALVGTPWRLESLVWGLGPDGAVSPAIGEATLLLGEDGTISGSTGCNRFSGGYELDGTTLTAGPLATTRMACEEALMDQERAVLDVLDAGPLELTLDGSTLRVAGTDDRALDYRAGG